MKKFAVECNWCFWYGSREKSQIGVRCPKCRKSRTVELFDPNKKYTAEEFERHRKAKLVAAGAQEIRPGLWISTSPRICTSKSLKKLKKFDNSCWLYRLLTKDFIAMLIGRAWRQGKKFVKINDAFVDLRSHEKIDRK